MAERGSCEQQGSSPGPVVYCSPEVQMMGCLSCLRWEGQPSHPCPAQHHVPSDASPVITHLARSTKDQISAAAAAIPGLFCALHPPQLPPTSARATTEPFPQIRSAFPAPLSHIKSSFPSPFPNLFVTVPLSLMSQSHLCLHRHAVLFPAFTPFRLPGITFSPKCNKLSPAPLQTI